MVLDRSTSRGYPAATFVPRRVAIVILRDCGFTLYSIHTST